jgi:tRNA nucleotidyltransferase/poly(A) polymerase
MADYMFMLENHLNGDQSRALAEVQAAASTNHASLFLTGGAMRDMVGGFPIRDLDFVVEGPAIPVARDAAARSKAEILSVDELRKSAELRFPSGVTVQIAMARRERRARPTSAPEVTPATIHEDLRGRDFTINSVALSLSRASRGLLIDPNNGLGDLAQREIRAVSSLAFHDDPVRILRLIRLKVRLGFTVSERTQTHYQNAREAQLEQFISPAARRAELHAIAFEPSPAELVRALDQEKLLTLFAPELSAKLNLPGLLKLQKAWQVVPFGVDINADVVALFLYFLTEKLTPGERAHLASATGMTRAESARWQQLAVRARKLESAIKSKKLVRPSLVHRAVQGFPGEEILFAYLQSKERVAQDRLRNYLQKYLPSSLEVTDAMIQAEGLAPGSPRFLRRKQERIAAKLDARPRKVKAPVPA